MDFLKVVKKIFL